MSGEGYKKGKLILNSYDVSVLGLSKIIKKNNHNVSSKQRNQINESSKQRNQLNESSKQRNQINESHKNRSAASPTGSSRSLLSNSGEKCPNPHSIMNWSKSEFSYNIRQNTQSTINETLKVYRDFQLAEIDHMLEERMYLLEKKILNQLPNNNFTTKAPANQRVYTKGDYDDFSQKRVLKNNRYAPTDGLGHNGSNQL
jgi:hypothetical protein